MKTKSKLKSKSKDKLDAAIRNTNAKLEAKTSKLEKLSVRLELKMAQNKVMKSLLIAKKMAKVFRDMVSLLDEIGAYEDAISALENEKLSR